MTSTMTSVPLAAVGPAVIFTLDVASTATVVVVATSCPAATQLIVLVVGVVVSDTE